MATPTVELGEEYKDAVTGFTGVATMRCEYLTAPPRVNLEALVDGKPVELWLDEARLERQAF